MDEEKRNDLYRKIYLEICKETNKILGSYVHDEDKYLFTKNS